MGRGTWEQSCDSPTKKEKVCWSSGTGPSPHSPVWPGGFTARKTGVSQPGPWVTSSAKCWFCLCCRSSLASLFEVSGHSLATSLSLSGRHTLDLLLQVGSAGHALRLVPTLTGNAQEASRPEYNWHGNSQEPLFRCPTSAVQVGSEPFQVLSADSWCDLDFSIFPLCALFSHHSHQTPTFPGPRFCLLPSFTHLLRIPAAHSGLTHSPAYPLTLSALPPTPQPWLFLSHMCFVSRIQFTGGKHNYGGGELQAGKYTLQILPLLNKFTLLGSFPWRLSW